MVFGTHVTHVWRSCDSDEPVVPVFSKSHLPKEMFLAAVGCPVPAHDFGGAIGLWPITEMKTARHASSRHQRGEEYEVSCTRDAPKFIDVMKNLVVLSWPESPPLQDSFGKSNES